MILSLVVGKIPQLRVDRDHSEPIVASDADNDTVLALVVLGDLLKAAFQTTQKHHEENYQVLPPVPQEVRDRGKDKFVGYALSGNRVR